MCFRSNTCNKVTGTVEAVLFPRNINTNHTFKVYRRAFCRPLPFLFDKQITMKGGYPAFLFKFPEDILDPNNPDNKCYCNKNEGCLPKGLSDLSPCYYSKIFLLHKNRCHLANDITNCFSNLLCIICRAKYL